MKKVSIAVASIALITWSIGLAAFVPVASATTIVDGDLVKAADDSAVYLIDGSTKRVFPHSNVYHSWGYPSDFSTVKTVTADELAEYDDGSAVPFRDGSLFRGTSSSLHGKDASCVFVVEDGLLRPIISADVYQELYDDPDWSYVTWVPDDLLSKFNYPLGDVVESSDVHTNGTLVKYADSSTIYLIEDGVKRAFTSWDALVANQYYENGAFTVPMVTIADTETYEDGDNITGAETALLTPAEWEEEEAVGGLTVSLDDTSPDSTSIPQDVIFTFAKFKLTASSDGDVSISSIKLTSSGLGKPDNIDSVTLYDNGVKIGTTKNIDPNEGYAIFNFATPLTISAGASKVITVKAVAKNTGYYALGIASADDIITESSVSGDFPVMGAEMYCVGDTVDIGTLTLDADDADTEAQIGEDDVTVVEFTAAANDKEDIYFSGLTLKNNGTLKEGEVGTLTLYHNGEEIATTSASSFG